MKRILKTLLVIFFLLATLSVFATESEQLIPSAPQNLRGFVYEPDWIYIKWDRVSEDADVDTYRVYRNGELVATTYDNHFLDFEYDRSEYNMFCVTAVNQAGNESVCSNTINDPRE